MSKATLLEKLTNKQYRDAMVSEEIDVGLPMQIREMRESRGWKQAEVAEKIGTAQPRFPVMEKPGYGNFSLNTLKKLAAAFDVGLIVSFVPFSEMIDFRESISRKRLAIPGFCDEYARLANRYARMGASVETPVQYPLFVGVSGLEGNFYSKIDTPQESDPSAVEIASSPADAELFFVASSATGGGSYASN